MQHAIAKTLLSGTKANLEVEVVRMGASISRILSGLIWTKKEIRILILGLVGTGPSSTDGFSLMQLEIYLG